MNRKASAPVAIIAMAAVAVAVLAGVIALTRNAGKPADQVSQETATDTLSKLYDKVDPSTDTASKAAVDVSETPSLADELPDVSTYKVVVDATTDDSAEIWSTGEKAGDAGTTDGWLTDMANRFNASHPTVGGKQVSVSLRSVPSGTAIDYLTSGKAAPAGWTPSSDMQVEMANAQGAATQTVTDSLVGNVAGFAIKNAKADELKDAYGTIDVGAVTDAVAQDKLQFGYTNPLTSATGMNFLMSCLSRYDADNPLSDTAAQGFRDFQKNVPLVAVTTQQMRDAADRDALDGFVTEAQVFANDSALKSGYTFVPFGQRHDNPLVTTSSATDEQKAIVKAFADYCKQNGADLARQDGFGTSDWQPEAAMPSGDTLVAAQRVYRENRSGGSTAVAVFVADTSGSMSRAMGDTGKTALAALQDSLVNGMRYISDDTYVGLVTYSTHVNVAVPPARFDMGQRALFKGGVEAMTASGETATYDAIVVAAKQALDAAKGVDNARPMVILLSDGQTNAGRVNFSRDLEPTIKALGVPVYTIGYNANLDELNRISSMTEAANVDADTDDVMYQIKTLFDATL